MIKYSTAKLLFRFILSNAVKMVFKGQVENVELLITLR